MAQKFTKKKGPVTAKQAKLAAARMSTKKMPPAVMPMDPEDMIDKGVDENKEAN